MGPISMYVSTAVIAAVSVPLVLKLVPPNRVYGVRTSQTLASREVWFRVNRSWASRLLRPQEQQCASISEILSWRQAARSSACLP